MKFEWDERKNKINQKKHNISFENAAFVFQMKMLFPFLIMSIPKLKIDG